MALRPDNERRAFLEALAAFWNAVHACGLHRISPRYLHCKRASAAADDQVHFYLFDLDKVRTRPHRLRWLHAWSLRRDNRGLCTWLADYLGPEEMDLFSGLLESRPATEAPPAE
jgi:hypothetical protein